MEYEPLNIKSTQKCLPFIKIKTDIKVWKINFPKKLLLVSVASTRPCFPCFPPLQEIFLIFPLDWDCPTLSRRGEASNSLKSQYRCWPSSGLLHFNHKLNQKLTPEHSLHNIWKQFKRFFFKEIVHVGWGHDGFPPFFFYNISLFKFSPSRVPY